MTSRLPAAVLWDMDGTLVDTEPLWMAAETILVGVHGGQWSHEKSLQLVGLGLMDAARIFQAEGVRMGAAAIVDRLTDDVLAGLARDGVPFRPGAREMLASLRQAGVKMALVTMSMRRMAQSIVDLIDIDAFDLVIAGDDVARPKPYPDPYLVACDGLGVRPEDAVAIEDSPNGLRSAVESGAVSIGVPNLVSLEGVGAHALWPTLEGRTHDDIAAVFGAHRPDANGLSADGPSADGPSADRPGTDGGEQ